jgi:hypothetical protein
MAVPARKRVARRPVNFMVAVWSLEWWLERRVVSGVETVRKWMLIIEGSSQLFYIYPG